jgi:hypothetical protein
VKAKRVKQGVVMEICKNKTTEKTFVYLDAEENGQALMITPSGEVKTLEESLFKELTEVEDSRQLLSNGDITPAQYNVYNTYHRN